MMEQFKILKVAYDIFVPLANGSDELSLHPVKFHVKDEIFDHFILVFQENSEGSNRTSLEHARLIAYERMILGQELGKALSKMEEKGLLIEDTTDHKFKLGLCEHEGCYKKARWVVKGKFLCDEHANLSRWQKFWTYTRTLSDIIMTYRLR